MILHGDCRDRLPSLDAESVDAVVTDPPYELGFMGKAWDASGVAFQPETWQAVLRVLKPGGHLLACGGTRTYHRLTCAIEDAGFEIRDCLMWVYGSGFPKSLDVSKAIDKEAGAKRQLIGHDADFLRRNPNNTGAHTIVTRSDGTTLDGRITPGSKSEHAGTITAPATDAAKRWQGWGTALKPSVEPVVLARKPLIGTVAQNVQQYGTGALNIDGCRVGTTDGSPAYSYPNGAGGHRFKFDPATNRADAVTGHNLGRWPANLLHDGSEEVVGLFPQAGGHSAPNEKSGRVGRNGIFGEFDGSRSTFPFHSDNGSAARFFYTAKVSERELAENEQQPSGRWPANLIHDGSEEVVGLFPQTHGAGTFRHGGSAIFGQLGDEGQERQRPALDGGGSAARFFYTAKASRRERGEYWSCDCETPIIEEWVSEGQSQRGQTEPTSLERAISGKTSEESRDLFTALYGNTDTGQYRPDSKSTISTVTRPTIVSTTSDLSVRQNTSVCTLDASGEMETGGSDAEYVVNSSQSRLSPSTSHAKAIRSTGDAVSVTSRSLWSQSVCARCGAKPRLLSHPTVKPLALMRYLVKLITPPDGLVLDPFCGSGTTGIAAILEGFRFLGIEQDAAHVALAERRIREWTEQPQPDDDDLPLFGEPTG